MSYFNHLYNASLEEFPHRARAVYMYLRDRAGKEQDCWPAVNTIAPDMNLQCVKRALNDLTSARLVEKEARYRESGSNTSNRLMLKK
ncbi:MAG: helix-turn-helix domain-containing protein [Oscillospiraceae bacterium]